ncbi:MAG: VWA domain-containing protein [Planctomycetota bacterium]|jgi:Mg-chelatase subunit ChlD
MASIKGISGFGLLATLLALAGAAGLGLRLGSGPGAVADAVDLSPSCEPPPRWPADAVTSTDSRLGTLLRRAATRRARRIRLFTDGCDLSGVAPAGPGLPVDVVLRPRRDDVGLLDLRLPGRLQPGVDFAVEVVVGRTRGPAREPISLSLQLLRDGARVAPQRWVRLTRGQRRRIRFRDRVDREGLVRYRAVLAAPVGDLANDGAEAVARVGDQPVVLALGGPGPGAGFLTEQRRPEEVAAYLADPRVGVRIDAILLRGELPVRAQAAVAATVRGGAGLVVLGGAGFAGEPLEEVLPLTGTPPEGRAALLLLDFSGSMQERKEELLIAVERLKRHFAPSDRLAFVAFRDVAVRRSDWQTVAEAAWELRSLQPRGNTLLGPALEEARRLLREAGGARRRLLVISDGEWGDRQGAGLGRALEALRREGIHTAALFVQDQVDPVSRALFPISLSAGADLAADLRRLENEAEDRTRREVHAVASAGPSWLQGAVPPPGRYRDVPRLYRRDRGEKVALHDGQIPLVAAWRRVGKVVVVAPSGAPVDATVPALVRACLREGSGVRLTARREAAGLVVEAHGAAGADFTVDGVAVPARPVGPRRWQGRVARVAAAAVHVTCGEAVLVVPPAEARELEGLANRPDLAAALARRTGGTLLHLEEETPPAAAAPADPAVFATLLAAVLGVLASALRRRRA